MIEVNPLMNNWYLLREAIPHFKKYFRIQILSTPNTDQPVRIQVYHGTHPVEGCLNWHPFTRCWTVQINPLVSKYPLTQLRALVHELIHVKQLHVGDLALSAEHISSDGLPSHLLWHGEPVAMDTPYMERPWEIEAYEAQDDCLSYVKAQLGIPETR